MKLGIVGLPNVGKSTLFNALTNAGALAANYPFATIEPNVGIVPVPDERLAVLAKMYETEKVVASRRNAQGTNQYSAMDPESREAESRRFLLQHRFPALSGLRRNRANLP